MRDQQSKRNRGAFVDRLRELAELRAGVDEALAGRGRLFTIAGEPGVGKSRLADEAASYASSQGMRVLWGRCWEHGGAPAYWPWVQAVRGLIANVEPNQLSNLLGPGAAEIAQIVPELRNQISGLPEPPSDLLAQPENARFRLFDSVVSLFRKAAETQPLSIVLDDLHAADPTSLLMLVALSRHIRGMRAMVIGTYREVEVKHSPERATLISQAEREGVALPLRGFGEGDIGELIERAWGLPVDASLVNRLHDITEGNPFFLNEVLRQMAAEGQLEGDAPKSPARLSTPRGVSDFIKNITERLDEDARSVLDVASVIGREFAVNILEAASGTPRERLIEILDEADSLELVAVVPAVSGRHSFRHALIREALHDALPAAKRRSLHRAVAEAIRGLHPSREPHAEIAYHYCQAASPSDSHLAIEYSRLAARSAEKQLAYEEAAHHLSNAVEALTLKRAEDDLFLAELLCDFGEVQVKKGDLAEARRISLQAADLARRIKNPEVFARAVLAPGRLLSNSGVTDHSLVALLNEAREMLGERNTPVRAQVLARLGIELYWSDRDAAVALCQQAAEMAKTLDHPHTSIVTLWCRWHSLRNPDSLEQRLADTREVIGIAEQAGERDFALEARYFRVADLIESGDIAGADVELAQYLSAEAELRDRFKRGLLLQGMRALMEGRLEESETLAQQAFAAGQASGRPLTLNSFLVQHGLAMWEQGRLGELEPTLRGYVAQNPLIVFAQCALQLGLLQLGRRDDARVEFERLADNEFSLVPRDWNWLPSMFVLAEVCADLGETKPAETLFRLLAPYSSHNAMLGNVYTFGSIALALGRLAVTLGRFDEAEAQFEAALSANRRIRAVVWLAHTQCEYAGLILTRGGEADRAKAQELIAAARRAAETLDLARLKKRLEPLVVAPSGDGAALSATIGDMSDGRAWAPNGALQAGEGRLGSTQNIEAVVESAMSRARDLSAQASLEGTVTILFSDIEDSSSLYDKLGDLRAHEVVRIHNEIFRQQVAAHRGQEVKALGDSFMIAFSSARRAALCAIAVQRSFAAYCEKNPGLPIKVRMGLHVGEAINESSDFFGKAVILAARIATLAQGGQILVSSTLHDLTANAGDLQFSPAGEKQLKGLAGTHQIFEVVW